MLRLVAISPAGPSPWPTRNTRPRRGVRWVIGLSVTGVLAVSAIGSLLIAGLMSIPIEDFDGGSLTATAQARVLDVDEYDDGPFGTYTEVDVDFMTSTEHVVTVVEWPDDVPAPAEGDTIEVRYDPDDPEYWVEWVDGSSGSAEAPPGDVGSAEAIGDLLVTSGITGGLAVLALLGTIFWARRAPRPQRPQPSYPYAAYGYPLHQPPYQPAYPPYPPAYSQYPPHYPQHQPAYHPGYPPPAVPPAQPTPTPAPASGETWGPPS